MEKVNLNPAQATSYFWVNRIKGKVRELTSKQGFITFNERDFYLVFNEYAAEDYRHLYLELTKLIKEDVNKYQKNRQGYFYQDTALGMHERLNEELSFISRKEVPDIRLASNDSKDIVIYTNNSKALRWYKSSGVRYLSTTYEPNYLLTGNEQFLDFYNLLLATIVLISENCPNLVNTPKLKETFCNVYHKYNPNIEDIEKKFDYTFNQISDEDLIVGYSYQKDYISTYQDIDLNGLGYYYPLAKEIVDQINKEKIVYKLKNISF